MPSAGAAALALALATDAPLPRAEDAELSHVRVERFRPPPHLRIGRPIGCGSHNRAYEATWRGAPCVLRVPRRRSDTQNQSNAVWELRHTLAASELEASPKVLQAWYARHGDDERWTSGLYFVMDKFDMTLDEYIAGPLRDHARPAATRAALATAICACLAQLASKGMFLYDLKPSNFVVRGRGADVAVRAIDFGRDYCEWAPTSPRRPDVCVPNLDLIDRLVDQSVVDDRRDELRTLLLFTIMLVILSSTTTSCIQNDCRKESAERRRSLHPLRETVVAHLEGMRNGHKDIVYQVLRNAGARMVLAHYNGRRNSGVRRTLLLAQGEEMP